VAPPSPIITLMSQISLRSVLIVVLLIPALGGCAGQEESTDSIALENLRWQVLRGFEDNYRSGIPSTEIQRAVEVSEFPIYINRALNLDTGSELVHSVLQTRFELTREQLERPLGIHFRWIGESWRLYVNGQLVEDQMILEPGGLDLKYRRIFRHITVPLNNANLREGSNTLVIHFAGYQHPTTIEANENHGLVFSEGYEIAPLHYLKQKHTDTLRIVVSTVYLFFGLYHLVIFSRRNLDRYNLFFGLFCFALALDSVTGTSQLHHAVLDTAWINRIKYFSQSLEIPLFFYFIHFYFFADKKSPFAVRLFAYSLSALGILFLLIPFNYTESFLNLFHYVAAPSLIYAIYYIGRVIVSGKRDSLLFGLSILILIASGLWGILDSELFHTGVHLVPYGFLFCILSLIFILANRFLSVHNESERLNLELTEQKNAFHRFVPTQFLSHLGRRSAVEVRAGDSVLRDMTVLFCDIRSFTSLSEGSGPEETFSLLNEHLQQMEPCIYRQGGFVDKYVGDAILSLFSDESATTEQTNSENKSTATLNSAQRAVSAAVEMARLARSAQALKEGSSDYLPGFGIGINSGNLVLGTVGSPSRIDTTVIGDTVNTCSRLESLTTHYSCPILISGETRAKLGHGNMFHIRQVDQVYLRGKKQKTTIYEVFDADPPEQLLQKNRTLERYNQALEFYRTGQFQSALNIFEDLKRKAPLDPLPTLYVERIKGLLSEGKVPERWDGALPVLGS